MGRGLDDQSEREEDISDLLPSPEPSSTSLHTLVEVCMVEEWGDSVWLPPEVPIPHPEDVEPLRFHFGPPRSIFGSPAEIGMIQQEGEATFPLQQGLDTALLLQGLQPPLYQENDPSSQGVLVLRTPPPPSDKEDSSSSDSSSRDEEMEEGQVDLATLQVEHEKLSSYVHTHLRHIHVVLES